MPLLTIALASVTLLNYSPAELRRSKGEVLSSRIVEVILLCLYLVPALSKVVKVAQIPYVTPVAERILGGVNGVISLIRVLIGSVPGFKQLSEVGQL